MISKLTRHLIEQIADLRARLYGQDNAYTDEMRAALDAQDEAPKASEPEAPKKEASNVRF